MAGDGRAPFFAITYLGKEAIQMAPNYAPNQTPLTPAQAVAEGEATVTMVFPVDVLLTRDDHQRVLFVKGTQEVPESLVSHSWLALNNVKKYEKPPEPVAPPLEVTATMTEDHVLFLMDRKYHVETVQQAQEFFDALQPAWVKTSFLTDFEKWKTGVPKADD